MDFRERFGARATVGLVALVAMLSLATGLVSIASGRAPPGGVLAEFVPQVVREAAGFTGTLTGFAVLGAAIALRKGYRVGLYLAAVTLPLTAVQGVLGGTGAAYSLPLVALSVLAAVALVLNRRRFDRDLNLTPTQVAAILSLVGAQAYGVVGTYALRDQFLGVDSVLDAFYFTIVTGSTVGYGDATAQGDVARLFAISALVVNVATFAVALGVLLTPAIEARLSKALGRMTDTQLDLLDDHVLVLGYGDLTEPILEELRTKAEYLVVTDDEAIARRLRESDATVLGGDPSDERTLESAGIGRARAVVAATENDAEDALAILTAGQLNPDVRIVAAATHRENIQKLKRAGADVVVSPAMIGGHLLVESALGADDAEAVAETMLTDEGPGVVQAAVAEGGANGVDDGGDAGEDDADGSAVGDGDIADNDAATGDDGASDDDR